MACRSLRERIRASGGDALAMTCNTQTGRREFPVPPQFTNRIEEQRALRESAALMDQSFHMADVHVSVPLTTRFFATCEITVAGAGS